MPQIDKWKEKDSLILFQKLQWGKKKKLNSHLIFIKQKGLLAEGQDISPSTGTNGIGENKESISTLPCYGILYNNVRTIEVQKSHETIQSQYNGFR